MEMGVGFKQTLCKRIQVPHRYHTGLESESTIQIYGVDSYSVKCVVYISFK
jgi:hypothetical protein